MAKYAEKSCADCGIILPIPELYRISDRQMSGESKTPYERTRDGFTQHGTRTTTHYSIRQIYLCHDCRRNRIKSLILTWISILLIGIVVIYIFRTWNNNSSNSMPIEKSTSSNSQYKTVTVEENQENINNIVKSIPEDYSKDEKDQLKNNIDTSIENNINESNIESGLDKSANEYDKIIDRAVKNALTRGEYEKWESGERKGYVVISDQQGYLNKICRNVVISEIVGKFQESSPSVLWCKMNNLEEWRPEPN